jgi:hypothetical protein
MDSGRMECLRLALGQRYDNAKPLTEADAAEAMKVAEQLYQWACQGEPPQGARTEIHHVEPIDYSIGAPA